MQSKTPSNPNRVFILGAGFSMPAGFPSATTLTNEVLDLLRKVVRDEEYELFQFADFVGRLNQWLIQSATIEPVNVEEFYEYANVVAERLRLEQHCSAVGRGDGETPYTHAEDLMKFLSYMDEYLLDVLLAHENSANLDAAQRFAAALRPGDTVVTFNYDRLVERCLTKLGVAWSYGMDDDQPTSIRILKMHGSLDWICFQRGEQQEEAGARRIFSKKDVNRARERHGNTPTGEHEYDLELFQIQDDARLHRLIEHRALIQQRHQWGLAGLGPLKRPSLVPGLGVVWKQALHALAHAEKIVVVGFSFSSYDRLAQIEFARVAAGRAESGASPARVTVIDPSLALDAGRISPWGQSLIARIEAIFRAVTPAGVRHEKFDWNTLA